MQLEILNLHLHISRYVSFPSVHFIRHTGGIINTVVTRNMNDFLKSMQNVNGLDNSGGYNYNLPNFMQPTENPLRFNEDAAAVERSLLASITMNNPIQR